MLLTLTRGNLDRYYLNMSDATKERLKGEVDEFGDFYCNEVDETDLTQVRQFD